VQSTAAPWLLFLKSKPLPPYVLKASCPSHSFFSLATLAMSRAHTKHSGLAMFVVWQCVSAFSTRVIYTHAQAEFHPFFAACTAQCKALDNWIWPSALAADPL
jgi:hypothetical protein